MQNKMILYLLVCVFVILQPLSVTAADKNVSDCLEDNEDCAEEIDGVEGNNSEKPESLMGDNTMEPGSFALNIVKMVFALLLILGLIYSFLWFLKRKRSYQKVGALENVGGISVGQNKSVQIVRIGSKMYLLGVGDNVDLLKELSEEEAGKVLSEMQQAPAAPAVSFMQDIFKNRNIKNKQRAKEDTNDFNASFQIELDKLKESRHQMIDYYEKKDDEHV